MGPEGILFNAYCARYTAVINKVYLTNKKVQKKKAEILT